ncbi:hypothetical protein BaRGS_00021250, partial [Batillaria attramentaria]
QIPPSPSRRCRPGQQFLTHKENVPTNPHPKSWPVRPPISFASRAAFTIIPPSCTSHLRWAVRSPAILSCQIRDVLHRISGAVAKEIGDQLDGRKRYGGESGCPRTTRDTLWGLLGVYLSHHEETSD